MKSIINKIALAATLVVNMTCFGTIYADPISKAEIVEEAKKINVVTNSHENILLGDIDSYEGDYKHCAESTNLNTEVCYEDGILYLSFDAENGYKFTKWNVIGFPEVTHNLPVDDSWEAINDAVKFAQELKAEVAETECNHHVTKKLQINEPTYDLDATMVLAKMVCD